ncbi:endolytic transglycosylase MltG [Anaerobacillus sp. MEB173]|uniref:endolytic transglycosylase MltG n=1 Tax=Anaerobacillus sp. MEB173 TaxID=3383345 RepID=UPI003F909569
MSEPTKDQDKQKKDFKQLRNEKLVREQEEASIVRKIVFSLFILIIIVVGAVGVSGFVFVKGALGPMDEESAEMVEVHIPIGSSSSKIGVILEENGLIKNATFFRYYVRYKNETGFQAGDYQLSTAMNLNEIIDELKEGTVFEEAALSFTIPEGRWLEDIVAIIAEDSDFTTEEIEEKMKDREYISSLIEKFSILDEEILQDDIRWPLEGYLFPARYDFVEEDVVLETIIETMIERTSTILGKYTEQLNNQEYSIHELMTLASIVEREAKTEEDRYLIAGVLYNRLDKGMPLQVDPTVAYALGEHRYMTTYADLEVDSPYNTYKYAGIPIGPIANPGENAIRATLEPKDTDYIYFYARRNGEVIYNETYTEHNKVVQQYRNEWVEGR